MKVPAGLVLDRQLAASSADRIQPGLRLGSGSKNANRANQTILEGSRVHRFAGHSIDYDMIAKVANLSFLLPWTSGMTFLQARAVPIMPLRPSTVAKSCVHVWLSIIVLRRLDKISSSQAMLEKANLSQDRDPWLGPRAAI